MEWSMYPLFYISNKPVDVITITIPFFLFLDLNPPSNFISAVMNGETVNLQLTQKLTPTETKIINDWFMISLAEKIKSRTPQGLAQAKLALELLINRAASFDRQGNPDTHDTKYLPKSQSLRCVIKILQFISDNFQEEITTHDVTNAAGISREYGIRLFKKFMNITIQNQITSHRLAYALHLLLTSHKGITEIALESGFANLNCFYRAFRAISDEKPSDYRKKQHTPVDSRQTQKKLPERHGQKIPCRL